MNRPLSTPSRAALALAAGLAAGLAAVPALAHTGAGPTAGLAAGFVHPVLGLDHVLAMVAVGVMAAQLGGRALWAVPAAFVGMMLVGGLLGLSAAPVPFVELGIAGSVVVLGFVIALGRRLPLGAAMALVGALAVFHGHAHGTEMPATASAFAYGAGLALATALLHGAGIASGNGIARIGARLAPVALRVGGGLIAAAGVALAAG
jgi:urease accessory protein